MDINLLFQAGMMTCGRVLKILPEKEIGSPTQYMTKVLKVSTLPSINRLYPYILNTVLETSRMKYIGRNGNYVGWRIPKELTNGLNIQSIKSCYPNGYGGASDMRMSGGSFVGSGMSHLSQYPNRFGRFSSANLYESVVTANMAYADLQLLGGIVEAPTPKFEAPNILWINQTYATSTMFNAKLCLDNDDNLLTLSDEAYEGVRRLFLLDLKSAIYNEYGILSNVETPLGNIDLRIDSWEGAESERNDLFTELLSLAHLRRHEMKNG